MNSGNDPCQCEEIVGDVEGEEPQPGPVPALAELEQRELREEEQAASSPAWGQSGALQVRDSDGGHGAAGTSSLTSYAIKTQLNPK